MSVYNLAEIVLAAFTVFGFIAGGYVVVRGTAVKQSAEGWKGEAEAQTARADRLQQELSDHKTQSQREMAALRQRQDVLEQDNATLRELVTGKAQVDALTKLVAAQHAETMATILALPRLASDRI